MDAEQFKYYRNASSKIQFNLKPCGESSSRRFLITSDTHGEALSDTHNIPVADLAIHCGDLTEESHIEEFRKMLHLPRSIKTLLKLVIARNHYFTMDTPTLKKKVAESKSLDTELVRKFYGDYGEAGRPSSTRT
ncbi:hypothetical protein K449DRAFT_437701 [Hypoxylon sp. EC38]|nr:hypothetical protein K449DRAFT_437701 [Hypoxylon sp. EC38]